MNLHVAVESEVAYLIADVDNDAVRLIDHSAATLLPGLDRPPGWKALAIGVHDKGAARAGYCTERYEGRRVVAGHPDIHKVFDCLVAD